MRNEAYDAIVVGSGISGGWAAKELTELGLRTLVLEAGRAMDAVQDAREHRPHWEYRFRGMGDRRYFNERQPVQSVAGPVHEMNSHLFVDDVDNPYTYDEKKPFYWIRGRHVGGRSVMWGRQTYRWSDLDFAANAAEGVAVDWPIRYADIAPWYDHVERFVGISGRREGLAHLPDGQFLPPMQLTVVEQHVRDRMAKSFRGERMLTIGRCAVLTENHNGRAACHYCGPCDRGCVTRSYFSSLNSTLPAAQATGRLTLRPFSVVHSVIYDPATNRATGVRVIDSMTREMIEFKARVVFLCASALESTRILLNSATRDFPDGLGNTSGELGHNLMDHTMGGGARATFPGFEKYTTRGRRPNGIFIPRFRNVTDRHPAFLRGYGFQGGAGRQGWDRGNAMPGFGVQLKQALRDPGPWRMTLYGFGECLPYRDNRVEIDRTRVDAWGIPVLKITAEWGANERAMLRDMAVTAAEILEAAGATDIDTFVEDNAPGLCIHEMGTARMGRDPRTSVLDAHNRLHDVPNVYVTDGACMTSAANQNPSITYMALTARAAHDVRERMQRNEI